MVVSAALPLAKIGGAAARLLVAHREQALVNGEAGVGRNRLLAQAPRTKVHVSNLINSVGVFPKFRLAGSLLCLKAQPQSTPKVGNRIHLRMVLLVTPNVREKSNAAKP